ncbi:hypothetical protein CALVIDRAFT_559777 [Calocera viscosa TUFC12733]|uniref:CAP-Gly domain-containing protein n=1 Tax=Calocera viscosa (strain TUFC12733) TaxID=1330018 RepID=A0A167RPE6_CALVF|nr:hypothetical protein CALVIDRAFT_559777 [Calocera viscosa TUFC12733]
MPPTPALGTRLSLSNQLCTIAYVGPIPGTSGTWLGVEWDDPARGKHDGLHGGVRYFTCRVKGAGSFLRPGAVGLSYGRTFLSALVDKYAGGPSNGGSQEPAKEEKETVVLGSSHGLIEVEAVGMAKVRLKLGRLDRLRDASLDGEGVASAGEAGEVQLRCPNLRTLDLSKNLLPSWEVVALIVRQLEMLDSLSLNQNRFLPLTVPPAPMPSLTQLQANDTLLPWSSLPFLSSALPNLQILQMGYNRLSQLSPLPGALQEVASLNLEGNALSSWESTILALSSLPKLTRLILASNNFSHIPFPPSGSSSLPNLAYLSLASNPLSNWESISALNAWLPSLAGLSIVRTPLLSTGDVHSARSLLIGRLQSLTVLNGTPITRAERNDAERFYVSFVAREPGRAGEHPRWKELCEKHGTPAQGPKGGKGDLLAARLVMLNFAQLPKAPTPESMSSLIAAPAPAPASARMLPSMPLKQVRIKVLKTLKLPLKSRAGLWACSKADTGEGEGGGWVLEEMRGEGTELERWALREGDWLVVVLDGA